MEDPSILILDEPLNGLDKSGVADMRELIKGSKRPRQDDYPCEP